MKWIPLLLCLLLNLPIFVSANNNKPYVNRLLKPKATTKARNLNVAAKTDVTEKIGSDSITKETEVTIELPVVKSEDFAAFQKNLDSKVFNYYKLTQAERKLDNYQFTAQQLTEVLFHFEHESDRLWLAMYGYSSLSDPQNLHIVFDAFRMKSSKRKLKAYVREYF